MPDVSKSVRSHFYTNSWTFASDVKKAEFSHIYCRLTSMPRLHLNFQNHNFTQVFDGWVDPHFVRGGCAGPHRICILPHVWMSDLRDLCRGLPVPKINSHSTTCFCVRNARSPQTVSGGKEVSHFTTPCWPIRHARSPQRVAQGQTRPASPQRVSLATGWLSLPPREMEELEKSDFAGVQIQFDHLEVTWTPV